MTSWARGAKKNRLASEVLVLPAGEYFIHYKSDGSHSWEGWNEPPPENADEYGIIVYFLEEVIQLKKTAKDKDYSGLSLRLQSNAEIINVIKENYNAISYVGLGFLDSSLKAVNIEGVSASVENVKEDRYPISRGLYIYANKNELTEMGKAYLDFVMSDEGQAIGLQQGFVPIN